MKTYSERQAVFQRIRERMAPHFPMSVINHFFHTPHADLGGRSPAALIHLGEEAKVDEVADRLIPKK
jgi:hypothetical protein